MPWHESPELFELHLRRVEDGVERVVRDLGWVAEAGEDPRWPKYVWTEGNFSCDCNRALFFARAAGEPDPEENPCGEGGFVIVKVVELATGKVVFTEVPQ